MKNTNSRIFGSGPACFITGIILVLVFYYLGRLLQIPEMNISDSLSQIIFLISIILTSSVTIWGFASLPVKKRGRELITNKAFKYFRHPIYAGFIDFFVFGLGFYLKSSSVLISGLLWIFISGMIVEKEENYLLNQFGKKYKEYQKRTKKFIPWIY